MREADLPLMLGMRQLSVRVPRCWKQLLGTTETCDTWRSTIRLEPRFPSILTGEMIFRYRIQMTGSRSLVTLRYAAR